MNGTKLLAKDKAGLEEARCEGLQSVNVVSASTKVDIEKCVQASGLIDDKPISHWHPL